MLNYLQIINFLKLINKKNNTRIAKKGIFPNNITTKKEVSIELKNSVGNCKYQWRKSITLVYMVEDREKNF